VYRARTGKKKWRDPSTGAASIATTKGKQGGRGHVVSCPYGKVKRRPASEGGPYKGLQCPEGGECIAPTALGISLSTFSQPLRAGLMCGAPTVLSEEAGPRAGREVQRKMLGFPTHIVGTPGKGDRDAEGVPHNSGVLRLRSG